FDLDLMNTGNKAFDVDVAAGRQADGGRLPLNREGVLVHVAVDVEPTPVRGHIDIERLVACVHQVEVEEEGLASLDPRLPQADAGGDAAGRLAPLAGLGVRPDGELH